MDLSQFNRMPPVSAAMTPFPHFVERKDSVVRIEQIMSDHQIRHVPVNNGDEITGIISQSDVRPLVNPPLHPPDQHPALAGQLAPFAPADEIRGLRVDPFTDEGIDLKIQVRKPYTDLAYW